MACLTAAAFLSATGTEFSTFGPVSTGTLTIASVGAPGDTITLGGVVLSAVAGARTPGSNDFSLATATVPGVAASILAAISDPLNGFATILTATVQIPGIPTVLALASVTTGYYSLIPVSSAQPLIYVLSDTTLTGGDVLFTDILFCTCSMLSAACWGSKLECAHLYLTAHFLTVASGGSGGTVASKSIDKISISYAVTPPSDPDLGSTKWGLMYLALRQSIVRLGAVTGNSRFVGWVC